MNISIKTAFFMIVLPAGALLVALLASPIISYWDVKRDIDQLHLDTSKVVSAGVLSIGLHRQMKEYIEIVMGNPGAENEAIEAATYSFHALDAWKQLISQEEQTGRDQTMPRLDSIEQHLLVLQSVASEAVALAKAGRRERANKLMAVEAEQAADVVFFEIDQMINEDRMKIDRKLSRMLTLTGRMTVVPFLHVEKHVEDLRSSLQGIVSTNDFAWNLSWQVREAIGFTFKREKYDVEDFYKAGDGAKKSLDAWRRRVDKEQKTKEGREDRELVKTVESDYRNLSTTLQEVLRLIRYGNITEATELLEDKVELLSDTKLLPLVQTSLARQEQELHHELAALSQTFRRSTVVVILFSMCVLALVLFVPIFLYKGIVSPLLKLIDAVNSLAAGKPAAHVPSGSFREINQLTFAFNQMAGNLAETEKLKIQLAQSEKMASVGQLAAGVAHEINNPLGIILGFAQSVSRRVKDDDPLSMPLKSIERESLRCKNLVQDLLTFSRVTLNERVSGVDANAAIRESLSLLQARAKTSSVELSQELAPSLPTVKANKNQLQQVIINLCNNAFDAMPQGGKVLLRTCASQTKAGYMEILVSDTGAGIPKEIQTRIFEPFYTTKEIGKGTGLGLSLVYEIVKKHEGSIELQSEVGQGSTFRIYLPLEPAQQKMAA